MVEWHAKYFHPNRTLIGVVGDFDSAQTVDLLRQVFGNWPKGPEVEKIDAPFQKEAPLGVFHVIKEDINQSNIIMGHLGIRRDNPDTMQGC
jgi:zinc protease